MNGNVYVDLGKLEDAMNKLKSFKDRLQTVKESQDACTKKINEIWGGSTGEELNKTLTNHSGDYTKFIENIDARISFLESVKASYTALDSNLDNRVDENAQ